MRHSRVRRTDATDGTYAEASHLSTETPTEAEAVTPYSDDVGSFSLSVAADRLTAPHTGAKVFASAGNSREQHVHLFQAEFRRIQQRKIRKSDNRQLRLRSDQYSGHHFINNGQASFFSRYACTKIRRMGLFCQRCRHCVCVLPRRRRQHMGSTAISSITASKLY